MVYWVLRFILGRALLDRWFSPSVPVSNVATELPQRLPPHACAPCTRSRQTGEAEKCEAWRWIECLSGFCHPCCLTHCGCNQTLRRIAKASSKVSG